MNDHVSAWNWNIELALVCDSVNHFYLNIIRESILSMQRQSQLAWTCSWLADLQEQPERGMCGGFVLNWSELDTHCFCDGGIALTTSPFEYLNIYPARVFTLKCNLYLVLVYWQMTSRQSHTFFYLLSQAVDPRKPLLISLLIPLQDSCAYAYGLAKTCPIR